MLDQSRAYPTSGHIAYHDYLLMLSLADAEWSQTLADSTASATGFLEPFLRVQRNFTASCDYYHERIAEHYREFREVNDKYPAPEDEAPMDTGDPLAPFLYSPAFYIPFGHADTMAVVMLDDFGPMHHIATDAKTTIEELCLAFCPTLDSLGLADSPGPVCELHQFWDEAALSEDGLATHKFQEANPLLVFTRYKMDALATLGQGLFFQQELLKAMVRRARDVGEDLRKYADRATPDFARLLEPDDVTSAKMVLLDLQGPEELGTLTFCRNYSVAMAFILGLRSLTFADVFAVDPDEKRLEGLLRASPMHEALLARMKPSEHADFFLDNHVFRWTQSSFAFSTKAFLDPCNANCGGMVAASSEIQLSPGHRLLVDVDGRVKTKPKGNTSETEPPKPLPELRLFQVGTGDYIADLCPKKAEPVDVLLPLESVLEIIGVNLKEFALRQTEDGYRRNVVDIATALGIPLPKEPEACWFMPDKGILALQGKAHAYTLDQLLPSARDNLCRWNAAEASRGSASAGKLDFTKLDGACRRLGLPSSLRQTIQHLFQTFSIVLGDAFLFDSVLDLYDVLLALHTTLVKLLPEIRSEELPEGHEFGALEQGRVEQLALLVDAIHNALSHRILKAYPESRIREMAVDFRGGLNQILLAADAPLKCSLDFVAEYLKRQGLTEKMGATTRVSFKPGAGIYALSLGTEKHTALAFFEMDLRHVLRPCSYCDYIHESLHLAFDILVSNSDDEDLLRFPETEIMADRISEIFATSLSLLLVAGSDWRTLSRYYVHRYSQGSESLCDEDHDSIARFVELLIRLFMAVDPVACEVSASLSQWQTKGKAFEDTASRFEDFVRDVGPLFSEYERICNEGGESAVMSYIKGQFAEVYRATAKYMPEIWAKAMSMYKQFAESSQSVAAAETDTSSSFLDEAVRDGLETGRPVICGLLFSGREGVEPVQAESWNLGPLTVICRLMYEYAHPINRAMGCCIHLRREGEERTPTFRDEGRRWFEFQVDRGRRLASALFPQLDGPG